MNTLLDKISEIKTQISQYENEICKSKIAEQPREFHNQSNGEFNSTLGL